MKNRSSSGGIEEDAEEEQDERERGEERREIREQDKRKDNMIAGQNEGDIATFFYR